MSARILISLAVLLAAGCATVEEVEPRTPTTPTPTCKGAADCDAKWSAARSYIISHASYEIQNNSVDRIETYNPSNEATMGLRAQVNKSLQPDGSFAIVAKFWCNNLIQCSPNADKTLSDFNRTVAAATSGEAPPPAVAAATSAGATSLTVASHALAAAVEGGENKAGDPAPQFDAQKYIRDSEAAWSESASGTDASVVQRILADDGVWILDGRTMDKAGAITFATRAHGDLVSNNLDHATVRFFGETAIAQGSDTFTRQGGKTGHVVWTHTWVRRGGQWQIVAAQDTIVP
jgi:hypothetical protein